MLFYFYLSQHNVLLGENTFIENLQNFILLVTLFLLIVFCILKYKDFLTIQKLKSLTYIFLTATAFRREFELQGEVNNFLAQFLFQNGKLILFIFLIGLIFYSIHLYTRPKKPFIHDIKLEITSSRIFVFLFISILISLSFVCEKILHNELLEEVFEMNAYVVWLYYCFNEIKSFKYFNMPTRIKI